MCEHPVRVCDIHWMSGSHPVIWCLLEECRSCAWLWLSDPMLLISVTLWQPPMEWTHNWHSLLTVNLEMSWFYRHQTSTDMTGQERYGNMTCVYYQEAVGALMVFDVTRSSTLDAVLKWKDDLDSKVKRPPPHSLVGISQIAQCIFPSSHMTFYRSKEKPI